MRLDWESLCSGLVMIFASATVATIIALFLAGCATITPRRDDCFVYKKVSCDRSCFDLREKEARAMCLAGAVQQEKREGCLGLVASPCPEEK